MRALWSRATQTQGTCRCVSCLSNATAIARRGGRDSLRGSWVFGTPTSTFFYTAIFAAGLTVDARAKAERNRQWEEAFAHLQEALDRPLPQDNVQRKVAGSEHASPPHGYDGSTSRNLASEVGWGNSQCVAGMELAADAVAQSRPSAAAQTAWDDLRFDSRLPGEQSLEWPANTGRDLVPHHLPPQSLWAPDTLRLTAMRRRHTWKKLAMQELSTGLLVHNMIRNINLSRFLSLRVAKPRLQPLSPQVHTIASFTEEQAEEARKEVLASMERLHFTNVSSSAEIIAEVRVHTAKTGCPTYFQDADGDFYNICKQMNQGIKHLLNQCAKDNDKEVAVTVAKICHNLLVSTAAPDLQTFNLLISGFSLLRRTHLVDDVIAAFFASWVRPNEIACQLILNHYTAQSRPDDFSRFVAKMRGVGDALMLADPSITINEAGQERLLRVGKDKVYQKVHPTPMVLGALINGVMKFAGFDRALDIYYEMKADGWGLDTPALTKLLADCIRRVDWEGGTYVWEEINSIKAKANSKEMRRAYYHMLSLCSVTGNTIAFNQVLNEVAKRGFDRKSIINAALKTTKTAQHKTTNLAPAWAADNLMIAVSSYVNDTKASNNVLDDSYLDEADLVDEPFTRQTSEEPSTIQKGEMKSRVSRKDKSIASKEAWSSWVEHEFGEKPKDPEP